MMNWYLPLLLYSSSLSLSCRLTAAEQRNFAQKKKSKKKDVATHIYIISRRRDGE